MSVPFPDDKVTAPYEALTHPKDLPVLGAALTSKADYLIILDKRHFLTKALPSKIKKPAILTPGDFIRQIVLKGKL